MTTTLTCQCGAREAVESDNWELCVKASEQFHDRHAGCRATVAVRSPAAARELAAINEPTPGWVQAAGVPKCEECESVCAECAYPDCSIGGMMCGHVRRDYDHCRRERSEDGNCGPTGRLFKRRAG